MFTELHFLRPWWLLILLPLTMLGLLLWRKTAQLQGWSEICDEHLLQHLTQQEKKGNRLSWFLILFLSFICMVLALAGPAWKQLPVPTYKSVQPRVLLLDMSEHMLETDLTPDRLSRAKFKLHDILSQKEIGQFALIAYTGEPFVVSPLTDDGTTISALLSSLTPEVMPVDGHNLASAMEEATKLIKQAGFQEGQLLVLTADTPSSQAIETANKLAGDGVLTSIMPVRAEEDLNPLFQKFAQEGNGQLLRYSSDSKDLDQWIAQSNDSHFKKNNHDEVPLWQDEGRWFLIPALLLFLSAFQRGWSQRMTL